jgi:hypothetical protein
MVLVYLANSRYWDWVDKIMLHTSGSSTICFGHGYMAWTAPEAEEGEDDDEGETRRVQRSRPYQTLLGSGSP